MKTNRFEVLSPEEVKRIHAASMQVLETLGVTCDYAVALRGRSVRGVVGPLAYALLKGKGEKQG